jgi:phosphoribosylanthranilate isomerase
VSIHIKICGFTEPKGLAAAIDAGVDSVGLVLDPSPRQLTLDQAVALRAFIPDSVALVAVCGRPSLEAVQRIQAELKPDWIQLMSDAVPDPSLGYPIIPAFEDGEDLLERVQNYREWIGEERPLILADGPKPGSGIAANWDRVQSVASTTRLMIAGGLNPENVAAAIHQLQPYAVDVSSGVERERGVKDSELIRRFVAAVRGAETPVEGEQ